jgi:hypothetical protein
MGTVCVKRQRPGSMAPRQRARIRTGSRCRQHNLGYGTAPPRRHRPANRQRELRERPIAGELDLHPAANESPRLKLCDIEHWYHHPHDRARPHRPGNHNHGEPSALRGSHPIFRSARRRLEAAAQIVTPDHSVRSQIRPPRSVQPVLRPRAAPNRRLQASTSAPRHRRSAARCTCPAAARPSPPPRRAATSSRRAHRARRLRAPTDVSRAAL